MGNINVLDLHVANLIAAGEVVDRPSSVIKELLENSLDAGSTVITVETKQGGSAFMRVTDNGCGMERDDVMICTKRHATSKIKTANDLNGILTLGFRGEALAAIASVSKLRIMTKVKDKPLGTLLRSESGTVLEVIETGCPDGTTVIVEELFSAIPARRKFLKRDAVETMAIAAVVEKIALSRPDVSIRLICDGILKFTSSGDNDLRNTIYSVLGRDFSKKLIEVNWTTEGVGAKGYIGAPDNVRGNRNLQNFFINGRFVKSKTIQAALEQAFESYIPSDRFPVCVLYIEIHPAFVDVNVHPAKLEVKFSHEQSVFNGVYCAVRNALTRNIRRPGMSIGDNEYSEEAEADLESANRQSAELKLQNAFVPINDRAESPKASSEPPELPEAVPQLSIPETAYDPSLRITSDRPPEGLALNYDGTLPKIPDLAPEAPMPREYAEAEPTAAADSAEAPAESAVSAELAVSEEIAAPTENAEPKSDTKAKENNEAIPAINPAPKNAAKPYIEYEEITDTASEAKADIEPEAKPQASDDEIPEYAGDRADVKPPRYRIAGEVFNTYVILELNDRMLIVDKHAAHERIIFEQMRRNHRSGRVYAQIALVPVTIKLSGEEYAALDAYRDDIMSTGFEFELDERERSASITQYPADFDIRYIGEILLTMAERLAEGSGNAEVTRQSNYEKAMYQASCKAAIKAGEINAPEQLRWICDRLLALPDIKYCPHGRPVAMEMTRAQIERQFKRS